MASQVDICNLALGQIGADFITSLTDPTLNANLCNINYPLARDAVLEDRDWTFATKEVQLVAIDPTTVVMPPEFGRVYALPDNCLVLIYCFIPSATAFPDGALINIDPTSEQAVTRPSWNRFEDKIFSNTSTLYARYLKRIENPAEFTTQFIQCLATRLAFELAMPITNKVELQEQKWKEYQLKLTSASIRDGRQGTPQVLQASKLTQSRY